MPPPTLAKTAMTIVRGNELSSAAKQRTDIKRNASSVLHTVSHGLGQVSVQVSRIAR